MWDFNFDDFTNHSAACTNDKGEKQKYRIVDTNNSHYIIAYLNAVYNDLIQCRLKKIIWEREKMQGKM